MALMLVVAGCGGGNDLPIVPVSGTITFAGGPCPAEGTISFTPVSIEEGLPRRPGTAKFQTDGAFEVTSFEPGDGLIPGTYQAIINCWKAQPSSDNPSSYETNNHVPRDYRPEVVVAKDADSAEVKLDVPPKKR